VEDLINQLAIHFKQLAKAMWNEKTISPFRFSEMGFFIAHQANKRRFKMARYIDNGGKSEDEAVIILDAEDGGEGIAMEKQYLSDRFGERNVEWVMIRQELIDRSWFSSDQDNRIFDLLTVELANGDVEKIYFDITDFFGKY